MISRTACGRRRSTTPSTSTSPGWTRSVCPSPRGRPGSYRLMNAFKNLDGVAAVDERGAQRPVRKDGDLTWIVDARGAERLRVTLEVRGVPAGSEQPQLPQRQGRAPRRAAELPLLARSQGAARPRPLQAPGRVEGRDGAQPHVRSRRLPRARRRLAPRLSGPHGASRRMDLPRARRSAPGRDRQPRAPGRVRRGEVRGVHPEDRARPQIDLWGFVPYPHYTFLFSAGGGGGLEHLTSTTIGIDTSALESNPNAHQGVIAHELFHAWNVKRLRPKALGPFDYDGPVRTKSLWISEGITEYYTDGLARSRGPDGRRTSSSLPSRRRSRGFIANPASRRISPEEASWTVWDGPYLGGSDLLLHAGRDPRVADGPPDPRRDQEPEEPRRRDAAPLPAILGPGRLPVGGRGHDDPRRDRRRSPRVLPEARLGRAGDRVGEVLPLDGLRRQGGAAAAERDQLHGRAGRRRRRDGEGPGGFGAVPDRDCATATW